MAIDTSIYGNLLAQPRSALQYQQDYAAQDDARAARQLNALQLRDTRAKLADAELGRQDQAAYRNLLAQNAGKPQAELIPVLEQSGTPLAMTRAQELRKAASEESHRVAQTAQANAAAGHSKAQSSDLATKARMAEHDRAVNEVLSMQSPQDAMRSLQQHAPKMAPEEVRQYSRSLVGISTPEQWQQWQDSMALRLMDAKSREELKLKRLEFASNKANRASELANRDLIEDPSRPGQFIINQPLNSAKVQRAAAGAAQTPGMTYMTDKDGNIVGLPTKAPLGKTVVANVVTDANKAPLPGKDGGMTEDQGKASGWLAQASTAFANMEKARAGAKPGVGDFVGQVPLLGGVGNAMRPESRQLFVQASESLSEALLRAATGAGVNRDEAVQKVRELTPQWGDSDAVIAQKRAAIPVYIKSLEARAGRQGSKAAQQALSAGGAQTPASGIPDDIQALLKKHGGK